MKRKSDPLKLAEVQHRGASEAYGLVSECKSFSYEITGASNVFKEKWEGHASYSAL